MNKSNHHTSNVVCRKAKYDYAKDIALSMSQKHKFIQIKVAIIAGLLPHKSAILPHMIDPGIIPIIAAAVKIPVYVPRSSSES